MLTAALVNHHKCAYKLSHCILLELVSLPLSPCDEQKSKLERHRDKNRKMGNHRWRDKRKKEYRNKQRATETEWEWQRERERERDCLTIRKGYGNIPVCVYLCVCFHPDPVSSTGAKHVTSTQAHIDGPTVPHQIEWLTLTVNLKKRCISREKFLLSKSVMKVFFLLFWIIN